MNLVCRSGASQLVGARLSPRSPSYARSSRSRCKRLTLYYYLKPNLHISDKCTRSRAETPRERVLSSMRRSVRAFEPLGDSPYSSPSRKPEHPLHKPFAKAELASCKTLAI